MDGRGRSDVIEGIRSPITRSTGWEGGGKGAPL